MWGFLYTRSDDQNRTRVHMPSKGGRTRRRGGTQNNFQFPPRFSVFCDHFPPVLFHQASLLQNINRRWGLVVTDQAFPHQALMGWNRDRRIFRRPSLSALMEQCSLQDLLTRVGRLKIRRQSLFHQRWWARTPFLFNKIKCEWVRDREKKKVIHCDILARTSRWKHGNRKPQEINCFFATPCCCRKYGKKCESLVNPHPNLICRVPYFNLIPLL